ncbi:von Willebrand factor A domain-containing protein 7-like, partial [Trichomycterus rosablanca]|uniref:von Willebrand factor A domain-containing protein 7-like n=1 Tax=Trichomycterus rosablanca TaxID=2290929 RepID=UPI002F361063
FFLNILLSLAAFKIIPSTTSRTHQDITRAAILQKTAEVCKDQQGGNSAQLDVLSVESVAELCLSPASARSLKWSMRVINSRNILVDIRHVLDPQYHVDGESFVQARGLITRGLAAVKASVHLRNYDSARQQLGSTLHTLQDFYSHSNWIELGYRTPYINLIRSDLPLEKIADKATPTCSSCNNNCNGNVLDSIISEKILTSGYFSLTNGMKPAGKCSHGGTADLTSYVEPRGGINKDSIDSSHGYLHSVAADVSIEASKQLLQEIRDEAGDMAFLRLMGIFQTSSALCFVIDTSVSMNNDITEVKRITSSIVNSIRGTVDEPSAYILVPFRDPDFGPVIKTTDSKEFLKKIDALSTGDGGEGPDTSLSALWLALASSPPASEIFLFTNSDAKDVEMKNTVLALIESTTSTVNVLLTNPLTNSTSSISNPVNQLYKDLASASGGRAIELSEDLLFNTTNIITEFMHSSQVTIFQTTRNPGKSEQFSFVVDPSVRNLTFFLTQTRTASSPDLQFTITAPSGEAQSSKDVNGSLGHVQNLGGSCIVRIKSNQTGSWKISISSDQPYTLRVNGQSSTNFQFDFVEETYSVINGRARADKNVTLLLSLLGSSSSAPFEVALMDASSSGVYPGILETRGNGEYLVTVSTLPQEEFYVGVKGLMNSSSSSVFQRQSSTRYRTSNISVTVLGDGTWTPGTLFSFPFSVDTGATAGTLKLSVRSNLQYNTSFSSSQRAGGAEGTVNISAPADTAPGTEVIVTIDAASTNNSQGDFNYAVLRLTVSEGVAPPAGGWICVVVAAFIRLFFTA